MMISPCREHCRLIVDNKLNLLKLLRPHELYMCRNFFRRSQNFVETISRRAMKFHTENLSISDTGSGR